MFEIDGYQYPRNFCSHCGSYKGIHYYGYVLIGKPRKLIALFEVQYGRKEPKRINPSPELFRLLKRRWRLT